MGFARNGLRLWLRSDFGVESTSVCHILGIAVFFACVSWLPSTLLQSVGRPDVVAIFQLLEAPLYLLAAWFLIKSMGIVGAALACALRVAVEAAFLFAACFRLKIVPGHVLRSKHLRATVELVVMLALGLYGAAWAGGGFLGHLVLATFALGGFIWAAWAYAFDPTDRAFVISRISQLRSAWQGSQ
jgi:O-antigen/teichoic acid export membrane protein